MFGDFVLDILLRAGGGFDERTSLSVKPTVADEDRAFFRKLRACHIFERVTYNRRGRRDGI